MLRILQQARGGQDHAGRLRPLEEGGDVGLGYRGRRDGAGHPGDDGQHTINAVEDSMRAAFRGMRLRCSSSSSTGSRTAWRRRPSRSCASAGPTACGRCEWHKDEAERAALWKGRKGAFGAISRLAPNYLVADGTVPRTELPEALRRVAEIGCRYGLRVASVFHAGDGNLHPLLLFDSRERGRQEEGHGRGHGGPPGLRGPGRNGERRARHRYRETRCHAIGLRRQ